MNIILVSGILLIVASVLTEKKYTVSVGFAFVFLIMGFQSGVEGDFLVYQGDYRIIAQSGIVDSRTFEDEPVFPYLMMFFSFFDAPYWFFVLMLSLFECVVLKRFVNRFSKGPYLFMAAILFFFSFNMMLLQMKAMRQGFAIELMLLAFLFMKREKKFPWPSALLAIAAYFTHNSSLVVVPFLIMFYVATRKEHFLAKIGNGSFFSVIMLMFYFFVYYIKTSILNNYLVGFAMLSEDDFRLSNYFSENEMEYAFNISWLIVLYDAIIIFLVSWYYRFADSRMRVFCWASMIAAFGDMLFFGIGSLPRIIMGLVVFNLAVYPAVAQQIEKKYGKIWAIAFLVLLIGYATKTSLPWMLGTDEGRFGTYTFIFMP